MEYFGHGERQHQQWEHAIKEVTTNIYERVSLSNSITFKFYNFNGTTNDINPTKNKYLYWVLVNTGDRDGGSTQTEPKDYLINGVLYSDISLLTPSTRATYVVCSQEGLPIAEFIESQNIIYILFDLTKNDVGIVKDKVLTYIMEDLCKNVIKKNIDSHLYSQAVDKTVFTNKLKDKVASSFKSHIDNITSSINRKEEQIQELSRDISTIHKALILKRIELESFKKKEESIANQAEKHLQQIIDHPLVTDISLDQDDEEKNIINILTDDIFAYIDHNGEEKRYYIGKFKITIDFDLNNVKFFNLNNRRKGYWTREDHHPHVNGTTGNACLGNVASTLAELFAQGEIYAIVMVAINFLQNANLEDPAGRMIFNWDEVDEDGNIAKVGGEEEYDEEYDDDEEDLVLCENCECEYDDEDLISVIVSGTYEEINEDGEISVRAEMPIHRERWCEDCVHDHTEYVEDLESCVAIN